MARKYTENYKLNMAVKILLSSLDAYETFPIHDVITLESGDGLPKHQMIDGAFPVYGGGGKTENNHNSFNIDFETIGIGRVGARCGCVFTVEKKSWVTDNALIVKEYDKRFSLKFLKHFLNYSNLNQYANNAMQPVISKTGIKSVRIPLLPSNKQNELGDFIEELEKNNFEKVKNFPIIKSKFDLLDDIDNLDLENEIQTQLISQLRQSILQEAIQGKLTEAWRKENKKIVPSSETLKLIKAEKYKMSQKGKKTTLPEIKNEEFPFEIPTNWAWTILDVVTEFKNGKAHEQYIDPNGDYVLINSKFVSTNGEVKKHTNNLLLPMYKNEIAIVMSDVPNGRALSRCFLIDEDNKYSLNQRIGGLTTFEGIDPNYLILVLDRNPHFLGFNDGKKQTNLTKNEILSCPIPLPPLSEQQVIVEKVETLLGKCASLQTEIQHLNNHSKTLLKALFNETFATEATN